MAKPQRIQLSRRKGWRMPENTVSVARPGRWGNPFKVGNFIENVKTEDRAGAVAAFREMLTIDERNYPDTGAIRAALRGKNLACWCPLDQPCHADVLLELANTEVPA